MIPKEAVVQTPPKDSKPLKVYARKRQRSNNAGGSGSTRVNRIVVVLI